MTEYLYDKENPKSHLRYKSQGWESFYRGMPNHFERSELIGRRLLKDYDGDFSKLTVINLFIFFQIFNLFIYCR